MAALLNTSKLPLWFCKSFGQDQHDKCITNLSNVANEIVEKEKEDKFRKRQKAPPNKQFDENNIADAFDSLYHDVENDDNIFTTAQSDKSSIELEKTKFLAILEDASQLLITTKQFWQKHRSTLPNLYKVARHLLSIPSSSAFVERFFSICGVICRKRAGNMSDKTLITRSFLKTNMKLLNCLHLTNKN